MLLGHEASGVVERIGPGVTDVEAGDHVVLSYVPSCGRLRVRASRAGRPCARPAMVTNGAGTLPGGVRRLTLADGGESINHHLGVSAFADHAVVSQASLVRIDREADLATGGRPRVRRPDRCRRGRQHGVAARRARRPSSSVWAASA